MAGDSEREGWRRAIFGGNTECGCLWGWSAGGELRRHGARREVGEGLEEDTAAARAGCATLARMASPPAAALPLPDVEVEEEADADHGEAWEAELDRRIADVREGRVECIPWDEVQAKARAILDASKARRAVPR